MKSDIGAWKKIAVFFLLLISYGELQTQIIIDDAWSDQIIEQELLVLHEEEEGAYEMDDILIGNLDSLFQPFDKTFFSGKSNSNWLKLSVTNNTEIIQNLYLGTSRFEYIDFWMNTRFFTSMAQHSGSKVPDEDKPVDVKGLSFFNFEVPSGQTVELYLKVVNKDAPTTPQQVIPLSLMKEQPFKKFYEKPANYTFMFIGAALIMAIFNLLLFFQTNLRAYFFYTVYLVLSSCFALALIPQFAIPLYGHMDVNLPPVVHFGIIGVISYTLVAREILEVRKYFPKVDKFLLGLIILLSFSIIFALFDSTRLISISINFFSTLVAYPTLFVIGIIMTLRKHLPGTYFLAASSFYLTGALIMTLVVLGVLPSIIFGVNFVNIFEMGLIAELVLFTLGIGARINEMKKQVTLEALEKERILREKEEEQKIVLEQQNLILEENVKERTAQVVEQKDALEKSFNDLKKTQAKLIESEKMASLGQLTAGVAHEINNPINFLANGVSNLHQNYNDLKVSLQAYLKLNPNEDNKQALEKIETLNKEYQVIDAIEDSELLFKSIQNGVDRTVKIVKSLRNFSRLDEGEFKKVDIHEGLDSTLEILKSEIKKKAKLIKNYGDLPLVACAAGRINQVFLNIINNALQAMEKKGELSITTNYLKDSNEVSIKISDTGTGMSDAVKKKLFEPFFTTKPVGEGTGMGLSISYGIIDEHKGRIEVDSEEGKGSTFTILLPVKD